MKSQVIYLAQDPNEQYNNDDLDTFSPFSFKNKPTDKFRYEIILSKDTLEIEDVIENDLYFPDRDQCLEDTLETSTKMDLIDCEPEKKFEEVLQKYKPSISVETGDILHTNQYGFDFYFKILDENSIEQIKQPKTINYKEFDIPKAFDIYTIHSINREPNEDVSDSSSAINSKRELDNVSNDVIIPFLHKITEFKKIKKESQKYQNIEYLTEDEEDYKKQMTLSELEIMINTTFRKIEVKGETLLYTNFEEGGEVDMFFDQNGENITLTYVNDANFRDEYQAILLEHFGINVQYFSLPKNIQETISRILSSEIDVEDFEYCDGNFVAEKIIEPFLKKSIVKKF